MKRKSFVVVTPNLNMGLYLRETIESVLANIGPDDEYYIIDGGSTDNSIEIIKSYEDRLTGWLSEPDKCYAEAVSKGLDKSDTEFQCWIASGDILLLGALEIARNILDESGVDMIFGDDFHIDENGSVIQLSSGYVNNLFLTMLYGSWTPLQDACFWRSTIYRELGGLNISSRYAADYDLFLRMASRGSCSYVSYVFSAFRRHDGQTSVKHRIDYKNEKFEAVRSAIIKGLDFYLHPMPSRLYYWFYARIKARLFGVKRIRKGICGKNAISFSAAHSSKYESNF